MEIAVIGGGHGGYAAAAHLSEAGHRVRLWRRNAEALRPVSDKGGLTLTDWQGSREIRLGLATSDLAAALDGALMNAGPIIHPPLILMNAGPLEHFEAWDIHNEGTQPSIRRVTDGLDGDLMAAGDLGLDTGKGFHDFTKIDVEAYRHEKMATFVALLRHLDLLAKPGGT